MTPSYGALLDCLTTNNILNEIRPGLNKHPIHLVTVRHTYANLYIAIVYVVCNTTVKRIRVKVPLRFGDNYTGSM